ncbi:bifunctional phosphoribosyl-AMP cyclohydrolase/phosphoribosyl-ATP diphosphatase HisIE [Bacillaceae bacterium SIJ1]|uniref:bifunctional phosphoribosyl-AMP cyclohydrolase/phosphoribosyl-ATP diphosphatase HisIE n=1 Tax=Litoribacterium kuwaitense TaxID=1398745 RepID=UPI0013EB0B48|nr:bifunctional phosphoribosyl-AMP cyclohydrolase/phosphoribosyl-ATP diphosphatase HisIE [Litoribacterium kuwaitense]NGP45330.1 bifunctional phosphoribosyl-AMP cyclohydrolase/phosphoribosyl-ATP diphosphatase HisIE [Litoribacterium kuwaitense]
MNVDQLTFNSQGLIPTVIQDANTLEVLMVAFMNKESLEKTLQTGETWFYSRSREELWHKGGTSGNVQAVQEIRFDCDADTLVIKVVPAGPACHLGTRSCFTNILFHKQGVIVPIGDVLTQLENTIAARFKEMPEGAYTTYLFEKGIDKILKKVGEEAAEVIIAAKNRDAEELKWEAADLLYHLFVLLQEQDLPIQEVARVLHERSQPKEEKASEE